MQQPSGRARAPEGLARSKRGAHLGLGTLGPGDLNACVYIRRMPRMQVYLPTDLYEMVKERRLPASELLQEAVRAEVRRRKLQLASRRYTTELAAQVGQPAPRERARAVALAQRIASRKDRKAG